MNREFRLRRLRDRAEQALETFAADHIDLNVDDVKHLAQELKVYQIELEMQNDELAKAQNDLEVSRNKFFQLFDLAPNGYFVFDEKGLLLQVNLEGAAMLDVNRDYLYRKPFITYVAHEDQNTFYLHRSRVFEEGLPDMCELRLINRSGKDLYVRMRSVLMEEEIDGAPRPVCFSVVMDLTDRRRLEESLREATRAAEAAAVAKSQFLANMSHEIRTPLNGILGLSQLLHSTALDDEQSGYLTMLRDSGTLLLGILNDILDISKIEAGRVDLIHDIFELRPLLRASMELFAINARENGVTLRAEFDDNLPSRVAGDPVRLRQILINLLGNAVKFTEQGEIVLRARLLNEAPAPEGAGQGSAIARLAFSVLDTGVGIPEDKLTSIFESFSQADNSATRRHQGAGLGLAISSKLARMMHGELRVVNRGDGPGVEASFEIELATPAPAEQEQNDGSLRVLLAESNMVNQHLAARVLAKMGHHVEPVATADELCHYLEDGSRNMSEPTDMILIDMDLPDLSIRRVAELLREMEGKGHPRPFVAALAGGLAAKEPPPEMKELIHASLTRPLDYEKIAYAFQRLNEFREASPE